MYSNNKLTNAVRLALLVGATAGVSNVAFAEEKVSKVERIEVTGSRIKQVDLENSSPVTVISAVDMEMSGLTTVGDVLNNMSSNSFGSWKGVSGYGSGASASSSINLRGLGSDATLVLLDGRRMPGDSSSSGASADTSLIPMSIVERIEVLRDGASAVYGSSAVAGVINIITKKDFDGVNVKYETEQPSVEGGDTSRFSLSTGFTSEKGNIVFTFEHAESDAIFDRELWPVWDTDVYGGYSTFSPVPNYKINGKGSYKTNSELCAQTANVIDFTDGEDNGYCGYNYGAVTKFYPDSNKNSFFTNFNYELTDSVTFKGRAMASLNETDARYAGTPVSTTKIWMDADNPYNPEGEDLQVRMRSEFVGARDTKTEVTTTDIVLGFEGQLDIADGIDWEANYQNSISKTNSFGRNLVNDVALQATIDSGEYDLFNTSGMSYADWETHMTDFFQQARHTGNYEGRYESEQVDVLASTSLYDNYGFTVAAVAGVEFEQITFSQISDPEAANGFISGGSGGDDVDATRDRTAAYVEVQAAMPYNIDVSAAARYEEYSQEGLTNLGVSKSTFDKVIPKVGITWRPMDELLVRGSWGESFRAPNMGEMFSSYALSFNDVRDTTWCNANPGQYTDSYCSDKGEQVATWFGGNANLGEESGESMTFGFVWNILDNLSVEATYYDISYEDRIDSVDVDELLRIEKEEGGLNSTPDSIVRLPNGQIDSIFTGYINKASLATDGIDLTSRYSQETSIGDFGVTFNYSYVMSFEEKVDADSEAFDSAGLQDFPDMKADIALTWTYADYTVSWNTFYVAAQDSGNEEWGVTYLADIPSYVKHNAQLSWIAPTETKVTFGVNNVTDTEAPTWYDGFRDYRDVSWSLYDLTGRSMYLRVDQSF
ncbi:TonB-dependent receptor domain-containing protein [Thalassotalea aquiviva]|uniref:TonB-dependent receptor domain-containing protein n=1 Tax=Thalassotalea aquiviva TaxID=3242415 RepID=UPI00352B4950